MERLKNSFNQYRNVFWSFILAASFMLITPGCSNDDDIDDLRTRVENLESIVGTLEEMMSEGAMIKSITPMEDNSGYIIEFVGGKIEKIEIRNGNAPMIRVSPDKEGNGYTLWYNITPGYPESGWVDTGINLVGPAGTDGKDGQDGKDGVSPKIKIETNADGKLTVWYNVTPGYPEDGWVDTGVDLAAPSGDSILSAIIENGDGTVTFVLNDGNGTEYTFARYSTVQHIEIMTSETVFVPAGSSTEIVFRVNPSSAWVPTGSGDAIAKWMLDEFSSRANYVNKSETFSIKSIMPDSDKKGQYIATIGCNLATPDTSIDSYKMALVLDNSTSEGISEDALVSSGLFAVKATIEFSNFEGQLFQDGNFYGDDKSNFIINFYGFDPENQWHGWYFTLNVIAPKADYNARHLELEPGTYTFSRSGDVNTVDYYYDTSLILYKDGNPTVNIVKDAAVEFKEGGTMTIEGNASEGYLVNFNIPLTDGTTFKTRYSGKLDIDNPFILSTFTESQNTGDIPITMLNYFANPYPTFASDIFLIQGYSSSIKIENQRYTGDGWILATQLSVPLGTGDALPDGEWTIANDLNAGFALMGYLDPAAQRAGTWLLRMENGELVGTAPIVSGKVVSKNTNGEYSISIVGKDDAGNDITATLKGNKPSTATQNPKMKVHGKQNTVKPSGKRTKNSTRALKSR